MRTISNAMRADARLLFRGAAANTGTLLSEELYLEATRAISSVWEAYSHASKSPLTRYINRIVAEGQLTRF